jgi:DNA-nicking Smr family endonuclease
VQTVSEEDEQAFRKAMSGVRPLPTGVHRPAVPKPRPVARFSRADRVEVLRESLLPPADLSLLDTGEELTFRRPGVREETLRRLRRGQYSVEAEIDLHGLGRHAAHDALRQFINSALARDLSCVRVIHGKGRGSGPQGPVLKHVVNHWLRRIDDVLAFASARPVDGGTGAAYVLLATQRARRAVTTPRR